MSTRRRSRYNRDVKIQDLHGWQVSTSQARAIQQELAARVLRSGTIISPRFIAGTDISIDKVSGIATAAVVVLDYPGLRIVESRLVRGEPGFPYIPGFLSFRELPLILTACQQLAITPDLIFTDGHGIAHPRRLGVASHLGLLLDTPTIGCAKSLLCGQYQEPGFEAGSNAEIVDRDEVIGAAVRTRTGVKPVYVSIGHRLDLETAIYWAQQCCRGYRLPEPTRLAHLVAGSHLKQNQAAANVAVTYEH
ncbi:MAG: deoxyribonuclease V [Dehalococcoidales bacterium]|nr:deoxyribonuclease V [Dehalococcoidales bacterium]